MSPDRRYHGAGAAGCALGGMLQAASSPVVLVARGVHLDALQRRGVDVALSSRAIHLAVEAVAQRAEIRFAARDVVILCTRSQDSAAALRDLAAAAPRDVPVVCAQNGAANEPLAAESIARVYALVVFSPCQFVEPGRISIPRPAESYLPSVAPPSTSPTGGAGSTSGEQTHGAGTHGNLPRPSGHSHAYPCSMP
jgi:ketopantoate reductase